MIVCSIDLMGGKAVQLKQGRELVLERHDVLALAERFGRLGEIAVIDLDAALGRGDNRALVEQLCLKARCRVGGGIRDAEQAKSYLRSGAQSVILGTAASPELLGQLPRERTIVALDARDNRVTTHGWQQSTAETPIERALRLQHYCGGFLYTNVDREGMLCGPDTDLATELRASVGGGITLAGGITNAAQIVELDRLGIDAQVGMAIYTGLLDPVDAVVSIADFEKGSGLLPTVVCDAADGRVRMFAYSNAESLAQTLCGGQAIYWSRSRRKLWRKGETSGAVQRLVRMELDCDRDAAIFYVQQTGPTCHRQTDRCFTSDEFSWNDLMRRIGERAQGAQGESYTRRLLCDTALLHEKLVEEAGEITTAQSRGEIAWECADLLYFMSVKMQQANVSISDVMAQLAARATQ